PGVAEIALGEDPRAIGGDAASSPTVLPSQASAAVDVVRVKLLGGALADVRVGHMEAAVAVPAGGVQCPGVNVVHTVDKPTVTPGQDFVYTVTVTNPNDCDLVHLKLVDTPSAAAGVLFKILSATPTGADIGDGAATWPDLGNLDPGQTKTFTIKVKIPPESLPGKLKALARATGVCPALPQPTLDIHPAVPGSDTRPHDDIQVAGEGAVGGPVCIVPDLSHLTLDQAKAKLLAANCDLGTVTTGPPATNPDDAGKVTHQDPGPGNTEPVGTKVDITVAPPKCVVPNVTGLS